MVYIIIEASIITSGRFGITYKFYSFNYLELIENINDMFLIA